MQYASGEISWIMVWDLDQEQLASSIPSQSESGVSALVRPVSAIKAGYHGLLLLNVDFQNLMVLYNICFLG